MSSMQRPIRRRSRLISEGHISGTILRLWLLAKWKFKYAKLGKTVHLRGLNEESTRILERSGFATAGGHGS